MKTTFDAKSLMVGALLGGVAITLIAAAEPTVIQVPPATKYEVKIGEDVFQAKTVQIRGDWVQLDGVDWQKGVGPLKHGASMMVPKDSLMYIYTYPN